MVAERMGLKATVNAQVTYLKIDYSAKRREARSNQASAAGRSSISVRDDHQNFNFLLRLR